MTKTEEIAMFRTWYDCLPSDSYLRSILAGVPEEAEQMIRNDWAFSLAGRVDDLLKERAKLQDEIKQLRQQAAELTEQLQALKRDLKEAQFVQHNVKQMLREAFNVLMRAS